MDGVMIGLREPSSLTGMSYSCSSTSSSGSCTSKALVRVTLLQHDVPRLDTSNRSWMGDVTLVPSGVSPGSSSFFHSSPSALSLPAVAGRLGRRNGTPRADPGYKRGRRAEASRWEAGDGHEYSCMDNPSAHPSVLGNTRCRIRFTVESNPAARYAAQPRVHGVRRSRSAGRGTHDATSPTTSGHLPGSAIAARSA